MSGNPRNLSPLSCRTPLCGRSLEPFRAAAVAAVVFDGLPQEGVLRADLVKAEADRMSRGGWPRRGDFLGVIAGMLRMDRLRKIEAGLSLQE